MTPAIMLEILNQSFIVILKVSLPILGVGLVVGVVVSIFQALTQVQEMTLTFVPKLISIFIALAFLAPFMTSTLINFSTELFARIVESSR